MIGSLGQSQSWLSFQWWAWTRRQSRAHVHRVLNSISLSRWCLEGQVHFGSTFAEQCCLLLLAAEWVGLLPVEHDCILSLVHLDVCKTRFEQMRVEDANVCLLFDGQFEDSTRFDCSVRVLQEVWDRLLAFLRRTVDLVQLVENHLAKDFVK